MSVERLTKRIDEDTEPYISCEVCKKEPMSECWSQENCTQTAVDRLSSIEDILGDDYDLDRLRELVEADREGRCVMLPCKVGDTVFQINQTDVFEIGIKKLVYDCGQVAFDETAIGVSIFTDREAAEAALKKEE